MSEFPLLHGSIVAAGAGGGGFPSPAGLYIWDYTLLTAGGYLDEKQDTYGNYFNTNTGDADRWPVETNDAETMVGVYQSGAAAGYDGWSYSAPEAGIAKIKFRLQCDMSANDTGHRIEINFRDVLTGSTDYVNFYAMGGGILQVWRYNGGNQNLINVSGLNGDGPRTVMGYITGTHIYIKGKNGYDDEYSWTTWNTDVNGNGAWTFDMSDKLWVPSNGNDTAPLTHGWIRKLEIMTPTYSGWSN